MKAFYLTTAALSVGLAACGSYQKNQAAYEANNTAYAENGNTSGNAAAGYSTKNAAATPAATYVWPQGARIVEENGVTYRIEPSGVRVALGPNDSRIVVENGVRYRVDPNGTRVRIGPNGVAIEIPPGG